MSKVRIHLLDACCPFLKPTEMEAIFGRNIFEDFTLFDVFESIVGLTNQKPWDCVGPTDEARATIIRLSQMDHWRNTKIVSSILESLKNAGVPDSLSLDDWNARIDKVGTYFMPEEAYHLLRL